MGHKNNGQGECNALQNQFTAYLLTALKRKKRDYTNKQMRINGHEFAVDFQAAQFSDDAPGGEIQTEDFALTQALDRLTARERYILFEHILNGCGYDVLAKPLGLRYNGVSAAYHRIIQKLRKKLGGEEK